MTGRVQFRASQEALDHLKAKGVNPNDVAKAAFEAEVRRMRAEERHERLREMQVRMPEGGGAGVVREDRDGRERWRPLGV